MSLILDCQLRHDWLREACLWANSWEIKSTKCGSLSFLFCQSDMDPKMTRKWTENGPTLNIAVNVWIHKRAFWSMFAYYSILSASWQQSFQSMSTGRFRMARKWPKTIKNSSFGPREPEFSPSNSLLDNVGPLLVHFWARTLNQQISKRIFQNVSCPSWYKYNIYI